MKIYITNTKGFEEYDEKLNKILSLCNTCQNKSYTNKGRNFQRLVGEGLTRFALYKDFNIDFFIPFKYTQKGKPYIEKDVYFNMSHSGDYVACAVGLQPVGIDIEILRQVNLNIAHRFFHPDETTFLNNSLNKTEDFFKLWTMKESYLKCIGKGLTLPLNSFIVNPTNLSVYDTQKNKLNFKFVINKYENIIITTCEKIF